VKRTVTLLVGFLTLLAPGCGGDAEHPSFMTRVGRSVGLADPAPRQTMTLDDVCDPSKDGTRTAEALDATLVAVLPVIAGRRLWILGPWHRQIAPPQ